MRWQKIDSFLDKSLHEDLWQQEYMGIRKNISLQPSFTIFIKCIKELQNKQNNNKKHQN